MDKKTTMENYVRTAFEKGAFNGVWLFAENGEIVSKGAIGWRDAEDRLPLREDSIFDVASISKQFTAAALMLLRREGLLEKVLISPAFLRSKVRSMMRRQRRCEYSGFNAGIESFSTSPPG